MSILITKKRSWLSYAALYLLLSCNRQDITVNLEPIMTPRQGIISQAEDLDTPLHKAILEQKELAIIQEYLKEIPVNTPGNQGNTPLYLAVSQGNIALIKMLLAAKADIHAKNTAGLTPLHLAVQKGSLPAMELLISQQNADINAQDTRGYTPLFYAIREKHLALVQFLLQKGATISTPDLPEASRLGNTAIMQLLLEKKANTAARDSYYHTPLILAAKNGHTEALKLLLISQADVQDKDKVNWTALHWAAYEDKPEVAQFLLDSKADIEIKDTWGRTPLHVASTKDQRGTIELLITNKANVYASDYKEKRPYDLASLVVVKKLLALEDKGISFVNVLFHCDYGNIGTRMLGYIAPRDSMNLRETNLEVRSMLFRKGAFNLRVTPDRLQSIDGQAYPRLYPMVIQGAGSAAFELLPTEAIVENVRDLQAIRKDVRLVVKSVVFKGGLESLKAVCEAFPPTIREIEIGIEIPTGETVDLSRYEQLKTVKVKNLEGHLHLQKGATVHSWVNNKEGSGGTIKEIKVNTPKVIRFLTDLQNKESDVRGSAASALGEIKISSPEVIKGLITALQDKDSSVRVRAACVLGKIKVSSPEVITGLLTALQDKELEVQGRALEALGGSIKVSSPEVITGLLTIFLGKDKNVMTDSVSITGLLTALQDAASDVRGSAASTLGSIKDSSPEVITGLLTAFQDEEGDVRRSIAKALGSIKDSSPEVITGLLTALQDIEWDVRRNAARALGSIKDSSPEVIKGLITALQDKDSQVRRSAALALGSIKVSSPEVITGLLTALQNRESDVRGRAAEALGSIKVSSPEVITGLLTALQDAASDVRGSAASALGSIKVSSPEVITGLLTALQDKESYVRGSAAEALGSTKVSSPEVTTGLFTALQDKDKYVRERAASALGEIKVSSPDVITGLVIALQKDNELATRKILARALSEVMSDDLNFITSEIVERLFNFFKDTQENADVRSSVADALDKMKHCLSPAQLEQLGDYYYQRLDYEKAAGNYSKLLKLTKDKRGSEAYAILLARTIEAYLKTNKLGNLYKSQNYFAEAESAFNTLKRENLLSGQTQLLFTDLLTGIGFLHFKTLNYPAAKKYFDLALKNLETVPNKERKVEYLNILHKQGLLALSKGNTAEALKKFQEAQVHYKQLEKTEKAIRAYISICEGMINSYLEINELDKAYALCNEVIKMIRSLGGASLVSFDHSIEMAINIMRLQLEAAETPRKKELVGTQLKQLLYNFSEKAQEIPELKEVLNKRDTFKPAIIQMLIDCYSEIDIAEADKWIKESNIKETKKGNKLEEKEEYYIQTTLLNIMAVNKTVQDGSISVNISNYGKKVLCKGLWENLNASERKEIRHNPEIKDLDLESLTTKDQEAIKDLIQANITEAVQYVYTQAKEDNVRDIREIVEEVACKLAKGIIKTKANQVKEQNDYLLRKEDVQDRPYSKAASLNQIFAEFCAAFEERLQALPKEAAERIEWVKKTCAWIEYRINLTDHFYSDQSDKVAGVLVAYVCALADTKMPVFLSRSDYFKGAPNTIREENSKEDEQSLQFSEWQHYYSHRFPSNIFSLDKKTEGLAVSPGKKAEASENSVEYYVAEANQNLEKVSKLVGTGTLGTTSYGAKRAAMKEEYSIDLLSSKIEADFTQEIDRLYKEKDRTFESDEALGAFVKGVAYNLLKSNIKIEEQGKNIDIFREEESGGEKWRIRSNFAAFIKELRELLPKVESGEISAKYLGALIHYRVSMTGRFFKDGNRRIALALETFVMMRNNHPLPVFYNEEDWKIGAPVKFKGEESVGYLGDLTEDARFLKWYYKYSGLFGAKEEWMPEVKRIEFDDPWKVMAQGALTRALEQRYTIYNEDHIFQDPRLLRDYVEKSGIEVKKLVVFRPQRVLLHETIAAVITNVALPAGDEEGLFLKEVVEKVRNNIKNTASFQDFANEMSERYKTFKRIGLRKIKRNVHVGIQDQYATLISKYTQLLGHHYAANKERMREEDEQEVLTDLIAWELLKREYQVDIEGMVSKEMIALRKEGNVQFLTMKTGYERDIWVLAGGPASGKTSIFNAKVKEHLVNRYSAEINACNINPDIFKPLLLPLGEDYHADRTHEESSYIKDLVLKKLENRLDKTGKAPSMVLDVVNPDLKKFAAILKDNPKINLYTTTCPVTDEEVNGVKVAGSITRAFWRASKEYYDKDKTVKNPDYGRYVPSIVVLDGHKKVSEGFPGFVSSGRYSLIELYDNTTRESKQVCHLEGKALRIDNFNSFIEFLKKRYINTQAYSKETVYSDEYVEKGLLKAEHIASSVAEYLKTGIEMNYQQHMNWDNGLMAKNFDLSLSALGKDLEDKQRAESVFEALIIDILKRHNLKGEFPIKLKEAGEKELSIFSNEIEKEGYLAKGSVFRFLRPVNDIILKEKGIHVSDDVLDKVSRDVLKMMLAKKLPREEETLIKYLPQLIETALYTANK